MTTDIDELHDVKGVARLLKRSREYVEDMKTCGFVMPGGRASVRMALTWLANNEKFTRGAAARVRFTRRSQTVTNGNTAKLARG